MQYCRTRSNVLMLLLNKVQQVLVGLYLYICCGLITVLVVLGACILTHGPYLVLACLFVIACMDCKVYCRMLSNNIYTR